MSEFRSSPFLSKVRPISQRRPQRSRVTSCTQHLSSIQRRRRRRNLFDFRRGNIKTISRSAPHTQKDNFALAAADVGNTAFISVITIIGIGRRRFWLNFSLARCAARRSSASSWLFVPLCGRSRERKTQKKNPFFPSTDGSFGNLCVRMRSTGVAKAADHSRSLYLRTAANSQVHIYARAIATQRQQSANFLFNFAKIRTAKLVLNIIYCFFKYHEAFKL